MQDASLSLERSIHELFDEAEEPSDDTTQGTERRMAQAWESFLEDQKTLEELIDYRDQQQNRPMSAALRTVRDEGALKYIQRRRADRGMGQTEELNETIDADQHEQEEALLETGVQIPTEEQIDQSLANLSASRPELLEVISAAGDVHPGLVVPFGNPLQGYQARQAFQLDQDTVVTIEGLHVCQRPNGARFQPWETSKSWLICTEDVFTHFLSAITAEEAGPFRRTAKQEDHLTLMWMGMSV